jgi:hypothetical protein
MTRDELITAATNSATREGWQVSDYTVSDVQTTGKECSVSFTGKSQQPGDHFTVYLDCATGLLLRLMPGR